ncbi:MAG TPA: hypothetical protein VE153_21745 [Myxococcus sp.]|nr:hypothetical protein [Myxococcus sp.]
MPWKASWKVVALAGLTVLMCAGGCSAQAQSPAQGGQAGQQALPPGEAADLWNTVRELRAEVSQLRREVARLRTQVADAGGGGTRASGDTGTGGSGTPGTRGASDVPPPGSEVPSPQGTAVVNAVYTGVVSAVSGQRVVLQREDGSPLSLDVGERTRVLRDGQRINVGQLQKGEQVRAVVDLVGQEQTVEIAVRSAAAPKD